MLNALLIGIIGYIVGILIVTFSAKLIINLENKGKLGFATAKRLLALDLAFILIVPLIAGSYFLIQLPSWFGPTLTVIWVFLILGTLLSKDLQKEAEHSLNLNKP